MARRVLIAVGASLLLADVAIVTLALPQLLVALNTTVVGVAGVLFVYLAALTGAAMGAVRLRRRIDGGLLATGGFALAGAASLLAGLSGSLPVLLTARAVAAAGAGAAVVGAFELIDGAESGHRIWRATVLAGVAVGPALGGVLAQAFDWRAIFLVQTPVLMAAATASFNARPQPEAAEVARTRPAGGGWRARGLELSLALSSAALNGALFMLVLVLISGWDVSPLAAAAAVSVLPLAALGAGRVRMEPAAGAALGCALVGSGALALAWIPQASLAWTIAPQLLAGVGAGMALSALAGELLPERSVPEASRLLSIRHGAIAVLLIALAPVISSRLVSAARGAELQGIALVLDAKLSPQSKFAVAPELYAAVRAQDARASLHEAFLRERHRFSGGDLATYDQLDRRSQDVLVRAVQDSFRPAFIVAGVLGLLAALLVLAATRGLPVRGPLAAALACAAAACPVAYAAFSSSLQTPPVTIADPCAGGPLPHSGGISGFLQDRALQLVDKVACATHTTREELVLAAASPQEASRFAATHDGVNPHSIIEKVLSVIGGLNFLG